MMTFWNLIRAFMKDTEELNNIRFSNEGWQRVKKLEVDIIAQAREESDVLREHIKELQAENARLQRIVELDEQIERAWKHAGDTQDV